MSPQMLQQRAGTQAPVGPRGWLWVSALLAGVTLVGGCEEPGIQTYTVRKDDRAKVTPVVQWDLPFGWTKKSFDAEASGMQVATVIAEPYREEGEPLEVTVTKLPPAASNLPANLNRWRGQLGLPPLSAEDDPREFFTLVKSSKTPAILVEMDGPGAGASAKGRQSMLASIMMLEGYDFKDSRGRSRQGAAEVWFIKMMGPAKVVKGYRDDFVAFVQSVKFPRRTEVLRQARMAAAREQARTPAPAAAAAAGRGGADPGKPTWQVPASWQAGAARAFSMATFEVADGDASAVVTVSRMGGDGGGALPNVNRWRGQVGLAPVGSLAEQPSETLSVSGDQAMLFDFANPEKTEPDATRMLVAMLPRDGMTWFFKMTGPAELVAQQRATFAAFVSSVNFDAAAPNPPATDADTPSVSDPAGPPIPLRLPE